ncbi:MAG: NTP transferase domain-containing protein [Leptospira sp.]|nr:NTP transferase domain-containing protein [Leptospira sp.]
MNAFILAAGFGKRMKRYTLEFPKPMLPIQGVKLLDYSLFLLNNWNINKGLINTHYLGEKIQDHIKSFKAFPLFYSHETEILGTGGGVYTGLERFSFMKEDKFLVINPDTMLFPNESTFLPQIPSVQSLCHLYLLPITKDKNYTPIYLKDGMITFEKINEGKACYYIGLSVFHPDVFKNSHRKTEESFELIEVWKDLAFKKQLTGEIFPGKAIDVGEIDLYEELNAHGLNNKPVFSDRIVENISKMFQKA